MAMIKNENQAKVVEATIKHFDEIIENKDLDLFEELSRKNKLFLPSEEEYNSLVTLIESKRNNEFKKYWNDYSRDLRRKQVKEIKAKVNDSDVDSFFAKLWILTRDTFAQTFGIDVFKPIKFEELKRVRETLKDELEEYRNETKDEKDLKEDLFENDARKELIKKLTEQNDEKDDEKTEKESEAKTQDSKIESEFERDATEKAAKKVPLDEPTPEEVEKAEKFDRYAAESSEFFNRILGELNITPDNFPEDVKGKAKLTDKLLEQAQKDILSEYQFLLEQGKGKEVLETLQKKCDEYDKKQAEKNAKEEAAKKCEVKVLENGSKEFNLNASSGEICGLLESIEKNLKEGDTISLNLKDKDEKDLSYIFEAFQKVPNNVKINLGDILRSTDSICKNDGGYIDIVSKKDLSTAEMLKDFSLLKSIKASFSLRNSTGEPRIYVETVPSKAVPGGRDIEDVTFETKDFSQANAIISIAKNANSKFSENDVFIALPNYGKLKSDEMCHISYFKRGNEESSNYMADFGPKTDEKIKSQILSQSENISALNPGNKIFSFGLDPGNSKEENLKKIEECLERGADEIPTSGRLKGIEKLKVKRKKMISDKGLIELSSPESSSLKIVLDEESKADIAEILNEMAEISHATKKDVNWSDGDGYSITAKQKLFELSLPSGASDKESAYYFNIANAIAQSSEYNFESKLRAGTENWMMNLKNGEVNIVFPKTVNDFKPTKVFKSIIKGDGGIFDLMSGNKIKALKVNGKKVEFSEKGNAEKFFETLVKAITSSNTKENKTDKKQSR